MKKKTYRRPSRSLYLLVLCQFFSHNKVEVPLWILPPGPGGISRINQLQKRLYETKMRIVRELPPSGWLPRDVRDGDLLGHGKQRLKRALADQIGRNLSLLGQPQLQPQPQLHLRLVILAVPAHPADSVGASDAGVSPHGFAEWIPPSAGMHAHETRGREHLLPRFRSSTLRLGAADDAAVRSAPVDQEGVWEVPSLLDLSRVVGGPGGSDEVCPGRLRFDGEGREGGA